MPIKIGLDPIHIMGNQPSNPEIGLNTKADLVLISLRRIIQAIDLHSRHLARQYGITAPQLILLKEIKRRNRITVGQLAKSASLRQTTVTDILNRMEKMALVTRCRNTEGDRRQVHVQLAAKGVDIMANAPPPLQETFMDKFENLPSWQQSMTVTALELLAELLAHPPMDAAPILSADAIVGETITPPTSPEESI